MSAANARLQTFAAPPSRILDVTALFKEDYPRRIDRFISFFGDARSADRVGDRRPPR